MFTYYPADDVRRYVAAMARGDMSREDVQQIVSDYMRDCERMSYDAMINGDDDAMAYYAEILRQYETISRASGVSI